MLHEKDFEWLLWCDLPYREKFRRGKATKFWLDEEKFSPTNIFTRLIFLPVEYFQIIKISGGK